MLGVNGNCFLGRIFASHRNLERYIVLTRSFLGAFAKLRKADIVLLCSSVRMKQLSSHWKDFDEI